MQGEGYVDIPDITSDIKSYNKMCNEMSKETRDKFRQALLKMFNYEKIFTESFIVNKYCTVPFFEMS